MKFKNLLACIYLKNGKAFTSLNGVEPAGPKEISDITGYINDSGIDSLVVMNLANTPSENELHLSMLKSI